MASRPSAGGGGSASARSLLGPEADRVPGGAAGSVRVERAHATLQNSMKNLIKTMEQANAEFEDKPLPAAPLKPLAEDKGWSFDGASSFDRPEDEAASQGQIARIASQDFKRAPSSEEEDSGSESDGSSDNDVAAGRYVEAVHGAEEEQKRAQEKHPSAEELMAMHKVVIEKPDFFNQKSDFEREIDELHTLQGAAGAPRGASQRQLKPKSPSAKPKSPPKSPPSPSRNPTSPPRASTKLRSPAPGMPALGKHL